MRIPSTPQALHLGRLLLSVSACLPALAQNYTVETFHLPDPKDNGTYALGINDNGDAVGYFQYGIGGQVYVRGFERHADGTLEYPLNDPDSPNGYFTMPTGINDSGLICGWYESSTAVNGFFLNQGVYQTIVEFGSPTTWIQGINSAGDFVGGTGPTTPPVNGFMSVGGTATPFNVVGATETLVNGLADDGTVVGTAVISQQHVGFIRGANGKVRIFHVPKGVRGTFAAGINLTAGLIVGYYLDASFLAHGFVYRYRTGTSAERPGEAGSNAPTLEAIDTVTVDASPHGFTYVRGVNASGVLVGTFQKYLSSGHDGLPIGFIATPLK